MSEEAAPSTLQSLGSVLDALREGVSDGPVSGEVLTFVVALLVLLLVAAGARFVVRGGATQARAVDYLTAATDLLGLSERDRRDLAAAARHCKCRNPISLLLSPANFARGLDATSHDAGLHTRLEALGRRLFYESVDA